MISISFEFKLQTKLNSQSSVAVDVAVISPSDDRCIRDCAIIFSCTRQSDRFSCLYQNQLLLFLMVVH